MINVCQNGLWPLHGSDLTHTSKAVKISANNFFDRDKQLSQVFFICHAGVTKAANHKKTELTQLAPMKQFKMWFVDMFPREKRRLTFA